MGSAPRGAILAPLTRSRTRALARGAAFARDTRRYDRDGDGQISSDEIRYVIARIGFSAGDASLLIAEADVNGDGDIDYEEFAQFVGRTLGGEAREAQEATSHLPAVCAEPLCRTGRRAKTEVMKTVDTLVCGLMQRSRKFCQCLHGGDALPSRASTAGDAAAPDVGSQEGTADGAEEVFIPSRDTVDGHAGW